ncbi:MAG: hypothetical protein ABJB93_01950 [Gaiellales bacterium]
MNWLDRLMDRMTTRGTKIVASGHAPADTVPPTGSDELSEELEADYGSDSPATQPPRDAPEANVPEADDEGYAERGGTLDERELREGDVEGLAADESAAEHLGGSSPGDLDPPGP